MSAREHIVPVFVPHLGCPNDCVFCNQKRITGSVAPATAQTVSGAIEQAADILKGKTNRQLAFYGGSFTAIPETDQEILLATANEYVQRGLIDSIRLSTRPDAIDGEVLQRLKKYHVETVELGAQSLDDRVLLLSGRGHTAEDVCRASQLLREGGFKVIIQMMTGLPGDTEEKCISTADRIIALKPDGVRIYPTVIIRDTALYDLWKCGKYREHTVEEAVSICARLLPRFEAAGIPIIRLGLNPTDDLSAGGAVAGAYHPALGELVKSRIVLNRLIEELKGVKPGSRVTITVPESRLSQTIGQHRCNVGMLIETYKLAGLEIRGGTVNSPDHLVISVEEA